MRLVTSEMTDRGGFRLPASGFRPKPTGSGRGATIGAAAMLAVLLAGCGNYGNAVLDDAPFYAALPKASDLAVNVPKSASQPACALGESKIAGDTRNLGTGLTVGVLGILAVIDAIRNVTPTTRTEDSRSWGPFPDGQHQGLWVQVTMTRVTATPTYTFAVQQRKGLTGTFVTTLSADLTGAVAQKGSGKLHYDYAAAVSLGINKPDDPTVGHLDIAYDLVSDPKTISLRTVGTPTSTSVDIASYADGQAALVLDFIDENGAEISSTSKFIGTGAGDAHYSFKSGPFGDAIHECWDALYCRTYMKDFGGHVGPCNGTTFCELGSVALCPTVH